MSAIEATMKTSSGHKLPASRTTPAKSSSLMDEYQKKTRQDTQQLKVTQHPALKLILGMLTITAMLLLYGMNAAAAVLAFVALVIHTKLAPKGSDPTPGMVSALSLTAGAGCTALMRQTSSFDRFLGHTLGRAWALGMGAYIFKTYTKRQTAKSTKAEEAKPLEIVVTVLQGRNLVAKDTSMMGYATTSDPYVVVKHGNHILGKTDIIKTTLDPKWKGAQIFRELCFFNTLESWPTMECQLFDHDVVGTDDPMGTVLAELPVEMKSSLQRKWYPVQPGSGANLCKDATGELLLEIEVIAPDDKDRQQQRSSNNKINDNTPFKVTVTIKEGRNLVPMDANLLGKRTSSDPFVVVFLGDSRLGKTKVIKKTLNPKWPEEASTFTTAAPKEQLVFHRFVALQVFDHDLMSSNDPMGTAYIELPLDQLSLKEPTQLTQWLPVERGQGQYFCPEATGEVLVSLQIAPIR